MTTIGLPSVLSWLYTTEHRLRLVQSLQELLKLPATDSKSYTKQKLVSKLPWYIHPLLDEIMTDSTEKISGTQLHTYIKQFITTVHSVPVVSLTLAFIPTSQQLEEYVSLLRAQVDESLIVDLLYDDSIIGGAVLSLNGQRYEATLLQKIATATTDKTNI